jgi:hypothetical protein
MVQPPRRKSNPPRSTGTIVARRPPLDWNFLLPPMLEA